MLLWPALYTVLKVFHVSCTLINRSVASAQCFETEKSIYPVWYHINLHYCATSSHSNYLETVTRFGTDTNNLLSSDTIEI